MPFRRPSRWSQIQGPIITIGAIAALEVLAHTAFRIPDPVPILLLTAIFATFKGGARAGAWSAVMTLAYLAWYLSLPGARFSYSGIDQRHLAVWTVTIPVMVFIVAVMKRRADHASDEIVRRERDYSAALAESLRERTRAEESLRVLFDRNLAGIFRSRRDGRMLQCNTAFAHLLGFASSDMVLGRSAKEFYVEPRDRENLMSLVQPGVVVSNHEVRWRRIDGPIIWVLVNVREVVEGSSSYLEGMVIDITDRKRAEIMARSEALV